MAAVDFYLASTEGYGLDSPRSCEIIKRLRGTGGRDYLLVRIEPPLGGQDFAVGGMDLDQIVLATRHRGDSLVPIRHWPVYVHVARLRVPYKGQDVVRDDQLEPIAWAELYATEQGNVSDDVRGLTLSDC